MKKNLVFIAVLGILFTIFTMVFNPGFCSTDFLAYWSSSHILVTGGNPYDQSALSQLEQSTCHILAAQGGEHLNTWNPPWLLQIFIPLGLLPYPIAAMVWTYINVVLIGLSLLLAWEMCPKSTNPRGILFVFLAGFLFGETLATISIGQITTLVMLGMLLMIRCLDRKADYLAGASLLLVLIKPQVTYFFLLVLLIWIIRSRRWKVIAGVCLALLVSLVIQWAILPGWVNNYIALLGSMPYYSLYTSTFGSFMDSAFHVKWFYLAGILLVIFIRPVLRLLEQDGWLTAMNLTLLAALPLSPFGFSFDQVAILPAITQVIAWLWVGPFRLKFTLPVSLGLALFYVLDIFLHSIQGLENYWFFVIPVIFFAIYFITWKTRYAYQPSPIGT